MGFIFSLLFLVPLSFASFESIAIKKLDLDYHRPYGQGTVEKVSVGLSTLTQVPYQVEVFREHDAMVLRSQFIDLNWMNPLSFFHNLEELQTKGLNVDGGFKKHTVTAEYLNFRPAGQDKLFNIESLDFKCLGDSHEEKLEQRFLKDCLNSLSLKVKKMEVPVDFFLLEILTKLPEIPAGTDIPADALRVSVDKGNFFSEVYLKYYVYAGLRTWGNVYYDDQQKNLIFKVDRIKFGYLSVTKLVMHKLKEMVEHPRVKIDPPYIRISLQ